MGHTTKKVTHLQHSDNEVGDSGTVFSDKGDGQQSKSPSSSIKQSGASRGRGPGRVTVSSTAGRPAYF